MDRQNIPDLKRRINLANISRRLIKRNDSSFEIRRATILEDLGTAYTLVGKVFGDKGYTAGNRPRIRKYEALPQMATFIASSEGRVVGVQSLLGQNPLGLPSGKVFQLEFGEGYCEATNQSTTLEIRKDKKGTPPIALELMRCIYAQARLHNMQHMIVAVDTDKEFYELLFNARRIAISDDYSEGRAPKKDKAKLIEIPLDTLEGYLRNVDTSMEEPYLADFFIENNPYIGLVGKWQEKAMEIFSNPEVENFFLKRAGLEKTCSPKELGLIRQEWAKHSIVSQRVR